MAAMTCFWRQCSDHKRCAAHGSCVAIAQRRAIEEIACKDAEPFKATVCRMPTPAPKREAALYAGMRDVMIKAHCADHRPAHKCAGQITIDRTSIVLQCPRCGDSKKLLDGEAK